MDGGQASPPCPLHADTQDLVNKEIYLYNLQRVETQANTFLDAFSARFNVVIPPEGRHNFKHLAASGTLKTEIKYALAQPLAALTRYGSDPQLEMPPLPPTVDAMYAGYDRFLILDLLRLNSTQRMRIYSKLCETKFDGLGRVPTTRSIKLCFELFQMKNICPQLTFDEFVSSVHDHYDTLQEPSNPPLTIRVERVVDTLAKAIFPDVIVFDQSPPGKLTDRSALLEGRFRGTEGAITLNSGFGLRTVIGEAGSGDFCPKGVSPDNGYVRLKNRQERVMTHIRIAPDELEGMYYTPKLGVQTLTRQIPRNDLEEFVMREALSDLEDLASPSNSASVVGLLEPLKVRTISIDSGILRYLGSRLQKVLWRTLSEIPIFHLIRGDKVENVMNFLIPGLAYVSGDYKGATDHIFHNSTNIWVNQIKKRLAIPPHMEMVFDAMWRDFTSIFLDYSNTLNMEAGPYFKGLASRLGVDVADERDWHVILSILERDFLKRTGSVPAFLKDETQKIITLLDQNSKVKQRRGQLMGNVLSFPFLCLINLTGWVVSAEKYLSSDILDDQYEDLINRKLLEPFFRREDTKQVLRYRYTITSSKQLLRDLPVRVNGDDILFQASKKFYDIWSRSLKDVGFKKSVGKNYFSQYFFTINSQLLVPDDHGIPSRIQTLWWSGLTPDFLRKRTDFQATFGYENPALDDFREFLPQVQEMFLDTVPKTQRDSFNRIFLKNVDTLITSFDSYGKDLGGGLIGSFQVSRSLPVELGGLGLELPEKEVLSFSQKVLAARLMLSGAHAPRPTKDKSLCQSLANSFRKALMGQFRVINLDRNTYLKAKELGVTKFATAALLRVTQLRNTWLNMPNDALKNGPAKMAWETESLFKWALACRRSLKKKIELEDVRSYNPSFPVVVPRNLTTASWVDIPK
jgi:hypothetical protein